MVDHTIPSQRIKRGDRYFTGRYWSAFLAGSVLAHIITLTVMSDAALSFIQSLRRTNPPEYPLLYVGLVYPGPAPLNYTPGAVKANTETRTKARKTPASSMPAMKEATPEAGNKPSPPPAAPVKDVAKPRPKVEKTPEPEPDINKPEGVTTVEKEAEPDSILVIRGSEETKIALASLPFPPEKKEQSQPVLESAPAPENKPVLYAYSTVKAPDAPLPHSFKNVSALASDYTPPVAVAAPPGPQAEKETKLTALRSYSIKGQEPPPIRPAPALLGEARYEHALPLVKITHPSEGDISVGVVEVKGTAAGEGISSVVLTVGKRIMELLLRDGSFGATVTLGPGENVLLASATDTEGREAHDRVKVNYTPHTKDLSVSVSYSGKVVSMHLKCGWRPHPLSGEGNARPAGPEFKVSDDSGGGQVSVGSVVPGIYTIGVEYDTGTDVSSGAVFDVSIYGHDPSRKKVRTVGPVSISGKGYLPAVRVLLPEGVFWEDDGWFTGTVQGGKGVTKYKEPEGIIWREEE